MKLKQNQSESIRNSYKFSIFPSHFSSWLTGKPLSEQKPLLKINWVFYVLLVISIFILALLGGFYNQFVTQNIFITILSWLLLIFSSRRMAAVILHQSVHSRLSGNDFIDSLIGDFVTILMLTQDYKTYKIDHCEKHHAPLTFATRYDPIVQFFSVFGINLGQSKKNLYLKFVTNLLSPFFHISFFIQRLKYNFNIKRPMRSFIAGLYVALMFMISWYEVQSILPIIIVYIIPMVFFYQISAFIEICSEHAWFENTVKSSNDLMKDPYFYADISWGRFCGSEFPVKKNFFRKIAWYLAQILYHLPIRLFILVGDLPQHDYHHRHPLSFDWINARYNREIAAKNLENNEPNYIDIWGIHNAIDHVFTVVSKKEDEYIHEFSNYQNNIL